MGFQCEPGGGDGATVGERECLPLGAGRPSFPCPSSRAHIHWPNQKTEGCVQSHGGWGSAEGLRLGWAGLGEATPAPALLKL